MRFRVRFTLEAKADIERLYRFLVECDFDVAEKALKIVDSAWLVLEQFPFSCRKIDDANPFLREFIISFGNFGYVALFEIENNDTVTVLAVRHQLEDDYY